MKGERRLILKALLGLAAGLTATAVIYILGRSGVYVSWASIVAAGLIGAVAGIAEKSATKLVLGVALGCVGWVCGEYLSRNLFHSLVTWICVGGFTGLTAGILEKSPKSMIGGLLLGALGGFIGMVAGFLTMANESLLRFDMQAVTIIGAAFFISVLLGLKRPKIMVTDENDAQQPLDERQSVP